MSKKLIQILKNNLPVIQRKEVIHDYERYGFFHYIKFKTNINITKFINIIIQHGVVHPKPTLELIGYGTANLYLVFSDTEMNFLKSHGYNSKAIGSPYIYINNEDLQHIKRFKNSLLVMPPHTLPDGKYKYNEESYIKEILKIKDNFTSIIFCIHQNCAIDNLWIKNLNKYDIPWIIGADNSDQNSLLRMNIIFNTFEYMTTCVFGSHIMYAMYSGCKTSIYGEYQSPTLDEYFIRYPDKSNCEIKSIYNDSKKETMKKYYPLLFTNPKNGICKKEYYENSLGVKYKKPYEELISIFKQNTTEYTKKEKLNFLAIYKNIYSIIMEFKTSNSNIILYGKGAIASTIFEILKNQIIGYIDSRSQLISNNIDINKVYSLKNLKNMQYDYIILSAIGHEDEFIKELKKHNIDLNKIILLI